MDIFMQKQVENFAKNFGISGTIGDKFEYYVSSVYLKKFVGEDIDAMSDVIIGGGDDDGIDIAAVVINNKLIRDPGDVTEIIRESNNNSLALYLIQAKAAEKYDTAMIAKFLHGVEALGKSIQKGDPKYLATGLRKIYDILVAVIENITAFGDIYTIPLNTFYVTTSSNEKEGPLREGQITAAIERIIELNTFNSGFELNLEGKSDIIRMLSSEKGPKNVRFHFNPITLPDSEGISEAFIAAVSARELLKIISEDGCIRENIFDDNVRLFQGDNNPVNKKILNTLLSERRDRFAILNNGITMVARQANRVSNDLIISDYQIVNGCQTSNQIFNWSKMLISAPEGDLHLLDEVCVTLKVIVTDNEDILSAVTVASNNNTAIKPSDIMSSTKQAKEVEDYFKTSGDGQYALRYARQSIERGGSSYDIAKVRVVNTDNLARAFASCILKDAAAAAGTPATLASSKSTIWDNHPASCYFYSAWLLYSLDARFRNDNNKDKNISWIKGARWHIIMIASIGIFPELDEINSNSTSRLDKKSKKKLKVIGQKMVDSSSWLEHVQENLDLSIEIVCDYFKHVQQDEGRSVVKDDVRARRIQEDLLHVMRSKLDQKR
ncbi:MAG: AIPR family protein [Actinomycetia bacterium]|nr:AIPR family protein [Actinomycetes bacterium]